MAKKEMIVDKEVLSKALKSFELEKKIYSPELSGILKMPEEMCYVKIRGASLEDHIKARDLSGNSMRLLSEIIPLIKEKTKLVDLEDLKKRYARLETSEKTVLILTIFHRCVLEPEFEYEEVVELSKKVPAFVDNIAHEALSMTSLEERENGDR
jgi:hypothetical protein